MMVNKYDAFAIKVYNWIIINTLAIILYSIFYIFVRGENISFKEFKEGIKEVGGLKK